MSAYVFNARSDASGGVFSAGDAIITFNKSDTAIITDVQISISRNLSPLPTLNKGLFFTAQNPQGNLSCGCIMTKSSNIVDTFQMQGTDVCSKLAFDITLGANGCASNGQTSISIYDGYASDVAFSANGQQGYIGGNVTVKFSQCKITTK